MIRRGQWVKVTNATRNLSKSKLSLGIISATSTEYYISYIYIYLGWSIVSVTSTVVSRALIRTRIRCKQVRCQSRVKGGGEGGGGG